MIDILNLTINEYDEFYPAVDSTVDKAAVGAERLLDQVVHIADILILGMVVAAYCPFKSFISCFIYLFFLLKILNSKPLKPNSI